MFACCGKDETSNGGDAAAEQRRPLLSASGKELTSPLNGTPERSAGAGAGRSRPKNNTTGAKAQEELERAARLARASRVSGASGTSGAAGAAGGAPAGAAAPPAGAAAAAGAAAKDGAKPRHKLPHGWVTAPSRSRPGCVTYARVLCQIRLLRSLAHSPTPPSSLPRLRSTRTRASGSRGSPRSPRACSSGASRRATRRSTTSCTPRPRTWRRAPGACSRRRPSKISRSTFTHNGG